MRNKLQYVLLFILVLVFNTSCSFEKPGEGGKAKKGYEICSPIISALESYNSEKGFYPDSLSILVPDFIAEIPVEVHNSSLEYEKIDLGKSFSLMFSYSPPGMNHCTYTPEEKWDCYGYY